MELVDNAIIALTKWMIGRGKGHAVVHAYH